MYKTLDLLRMDDGGIFVWMLFILISAWGAHYGYTRYKFRKTWKPHQLFESINKRDASGVEKHIKDVSSTVVDSRGRGLLHAAAATKNKEVVAAALRGIKGDPHVSCKITVIVDCIDFTESHEEVWHVLCYGAKIECGPSIMGRLVELTADISVIQESLGIIQSRYPDDQLGSTWSDDDRDVKRILRDRIAELLDARGEVVSDFHAQAV